MAIPLTPDRWLTILRAEGVKVAEHSGWRTRKRDGATGLPFGPVHMILNHHTASTSSLKVVAETGVPGLPAPLAHAHLAKSGLVTMCSAGRANHAGLMAVNAYNSFLHESSTHPAPSRASGTVDGNDRAYGIETENEGDGKDVYTRAQYDAWVRFNAAVCRHHGWSADSCGGHLETSVEGKIDPKGPVEGYGSRGRFTFSMKQFRADVAERLRHPASWNPGAAEAQPKPPAPAPKPAAPDRTPAEDVWYADVIEAVPPPLGNSDYETNPTWTARYALFTAVRDARAARANSEAALREIREIRALLAAFRTDEGETA
jgi:hypothetical protein